MGNILVTGSSGLIGSEAVEHFDRQGRSIVGVDNNLRREFFGSAGDTTWNLERLKRSTSNFRHYDLDIRDRDGIMALFRQNSISLVIHCAAQPSHDKARDIPLTDFEVNALGTLNLLEEVSAAGIDTFIFTSTTSVFGLALTPSSGEPAAWITEEVVPAPRNIFHLRRTS